MSLVPISHLKLLIWGNVGTRVPTISFTALTFLMQKTRNYNPQKYNKTSEKINSTDLHFSSAEVINNLCKCSSDSQKFNSDLLEGSKNWRIWYLVCPWGHLCVTHTFFCITCIKIIQLLLWLLRVLILKCHTRKAYSSKWPTDRRKFHNSEGSVSFLFSLSLWKDKWNSWAGVREKLSFIFGLKFSCDPN